MSIPGKETFLGGKAKYSSDDNIQLKLDSLMAFDHCVKMFVQVLRHCQIEFYEQNATLFTFRIDKSVRNFVEVFCSFN